MVSAKELVSMLEKWIDEHPDEAKELWVKIESLPIVAFPPKGVEKFMDSILKGKRWKYD